MNPAIQFSKLAEEYRRVELDERNATAVYASHVQRMLAENPAAQLALETSRRAEAKLNEMKEQLIALAREAKHTLDNAGIKAAYSEPMTTKIDGINLLALCPTAERIPGLIEDIKINKEVFEAAVTMGHISRDVAAQVSARVPTTKNGTVKLTV